MRGPNGYPVCQAQCIFFREETTGSTDGTSNNGVKLKLYKKCQLNQKNPQNPKTRNYWDELFQYCEFHS